MNRPTAAHIPLCDEGRSSSALVPPSRGKDTDGLVVARKAVDTGLNENQAAINISITTYISHTLYIQLGVLVLAVGRQVLADGDGFLDKHVEVLGDLRSEA